MSETVLYLNLNTYPIAITTERGMSLTVNSYKAVKGEYFATWAAPRGPLSMVHETEVSPEAIIYEAKPWAVTDEARWLETKAKLDPAIFEVPEFLAVKPDTNADTTSVSEPETEEAAAVVTSEEDQTEQQPKRKKKK